MPARLGPTGHAHEDVGMAPRNGAVRPGIPSYCPPTLRDPGRDHRMSRVFWIVFGASTHGLFLVTVWRLYPFLEQGGRFRGGLAPSFGTWWAACLVDAALAVQFGVVHSVLLLPRVRQALGRWIPSAHYGCFFCVA